jgi:hypothetical protein
LPALPFGAAMPSPTHRHPPLHHGHGPTLHED